ncbi:hypothetical protein H4219_005654 [Mycoemilia scoparia]|uniref:Uncharacterized protein n=1 Tax=Mycoemilia scoparia TaxID=417184 RepID=A0A9W8DP35_9FUNG|nr:hypothetical protein H4219_005654 [Mycoemilia scoparia]
MFDFSNISVLNCIRPNPKRSRTESAPSTPSKNRTLKNSLSSTSACTGDLPKMRKVSSGTTALFDNNSSSSRGAMSSGIIPPPAVPLTAAKRKSSAPPAFNIPCPTSSDESMFSLYDQKYHNEYSTISGTPGGWRSRPMGRRSKTFDSLACAAPIPPGIYNPRNNHHHHNDANIGRGGGSKGTLDITLRFPPISMNTKIKDPEGTSMYPRPQQMPRLQHSFEQYQNRHHRSQNNNPHPSAAAVGGSGGAPKVKPAFPLIRSSSKGKNIQSVYGIGHGHHNPSHHNLAQIPPKITTQVAKAASSPSLSVATNISAGQTNCTKNSDNMKEFDHPSDEDDDDGFDNESRIEGCMSPRAEIINLYAENGAFGRRTCL